jgi:phage baseplate assembly protein gpV
MDTTTIHSRDGRIISYDPSEDLLLVESSTGSAVIVIDLANDRVTIRSQGDLTVEAGGKLRLVGKAGVEVESEGTSSVRSAGDLSIVSDSETIVRGQMVRIN